MNLLFAYFAGLLTLINPCVLPVLPIVLASALQEDRRAPLALAFGMSVAFVVLGTAVAAIGPAIGLRAEQVADAGAVAMIVFGLVLLVPAFGRSFATATAGMAMRADAQLGHGPAAPTGRARALAGQAVGGALLGAVWSPCIGPTLGAAIALASTGQNLGSAALTMTAFALGVSTLVVLGGTAARQWLRRNAGRLSGLSARARPLLGLAFALVGLALLFRLNHPVEAWLLQVMPAWLVDQSVAL